MSTLSVSLTVNGKPRTMSVEPRASLGSALRQELGFTGVHLGCEHGICGACNVLVGGRSMRACLMLAVQAEGADIVTVEALANDARYAALLQSFRDHRALQCGFCTSGILMSAVELLASSPEADDEEIREFLSGNICRCTGYQPIVAAIRDAGRRMAAGDHQPGGSE